MKGNEVKIAIIGVCLLGAAFFGFRALFGGSDVPEEFKKQIPPGVWYKCTKCKHEFEIPSDKLESTPMKEVVLSNDAAPGLRMAPKKLQFVECPTCKEMTALFGARCNKHELVYYSFNEDGTRGSCPKCVEELETGGG